jgi:hypothetical protein
MIRSREVIPLSLEHALVANRVIAALASLDLNTEESKDAMQSGVAFLNSMLQGQRLSASRSVQIDSYRPALAYGEGVRAFALTRAEADIDPVAYLQDLVQKATRLAAHPERGDEQDIGNLVKFFRTVRDLALASSDRPVERVVW